MPNLSTTRASGLTIIALLSAAACSDSAAPSAAAPGPVPAAGSGSLAPSNGTATPAAPAAGNTTPAASGAPQPGPSVGTPAAASGARTPVPAAMPQPGAPAAPGGAPVTPASPGTAPVQPAQPAQPTMGANTPVNQIPAQCKGFEVLGLKASPGGAVLPNTCAPFDAALNNPYAIRCVDADPNYKTAYAGDEFCILPPAAGMGTQLHIAPESYDNPGAFELAAGKEVTEYYNINSSNAEARYYFRANWRMRPGGHHMLISLPAQDQTDGWTRIGDMGSEFGGAAKSFGGSQRSVVDRPQGTLEIPPENVGLGQELQARQQFTFNLHSINTMSKPALREVWLNIWYMDQKEVTKPMLTIAATGNPADMSIAAHRTAMLEYKCAVSGESRLVTMYGHYHAHGEHFSTWIKRAAGEQVQVYDSFDWEDIPVYQFDSVSKNPAADVAKKVDGALSGPLTLRAGDEVHFRCEVNNTTDQALRFANEAITGEMCILFMSYTGANPCPGAPQRVN